MRVELFGVLRHRAGVASVEIEAATLGQALVEICRRLPQLANVCGADGHLNRGYLASVNGRQFIVDPATPLAGGESLLLMSADAGG
jgi:molybdopterin converting factor small subunit